MEPVGQSSSFPPCREKFSECFQGEYSSFETSLLNNKIRKEQRTTQIFSMTLAVYLYEKNIKVKDSISLHCLFSLFLSHLT
jgi:hypothetical protein